MFLHRPTTQSTLMACNFQTVIEESTNVVADEAQFDVVEDEHVRCFSQQREVEPFMDSSLRVTGNKEFDPQDLRYELAKDR